eukprot:1673212-Rhodomonas_salina.3
MQLSAGRCWVHGCSACNAMTRTVCCAVHAELAAMPVLCVVAALCHHNPLTRHFVIAEEEREEDGHQSVHP